MTLHGIQGTLAYTLNIILTVEEEVKNFAVRHDDIVYAGEMDEVLTLLDNTGL